MLNELIEICKGYFPHHPSHLKQKLIAALEKVDFSIGANLLPIEGIDFYELYSGDSFIIGLFILATDAVIPVI